MAKKKRPPKETPMTARDFCFWLQGFFELSVAGDSGLDEEQVEIVQRHLALVFVHEIDPSAGSPEHQAALNKLHAKIDAVAKTASKASMGPPIMRC
jgi:cobyrinic acid a,c-diamide synthase